MRLRKLVILSQLLVVPSLVVAQDTPVQKQVKVARDSILCTASASKRQQRACARLDSIIVTPLALPVATCTLPACNPGSPGNISYSINTFRAIEAFATDTTLCGVVESMDGTRGLTWPPIAIRWVGDSASWVGRDGNVPLTSKCATAIAATGSDTTRVPVSWVGFWMVDVNGRRTFEPLAVVK